MITRLHDAVVALTSRLLLVSDGANWALDEQARRIAANLPYPLRAEVIQWLPPWGRGRIVHFVNRYAALDTHVLERLAGRDRVIVTWTHGGAIEQTEPELAQLLERMRENVRRIDLVHVQSTLYVPVIAALGVPRERIRLAALGVDNVRFSPREDSRHARLALGLAPDRVYLGSFQRDGEVAPKLVKGPDVLVELASRLYRHYPRLVVLLTGPARGWVKRALAERGVPFHHSGVVAPSELVHHYRASDVYAITAREEGGPLALLEAMACGVPVVSTRVGMSVDLIRHGENGALVDVGDLNGLVEHASALLDDRGVAARMCLAASETARENDWRVVGRHYAERIYQPLLS